MRGSLRNRLLAGITASIVLLLAGFGLFIYVSVRHALLNEFDQALATTAHTVASVVMVDEQELEFEFDPNQVPELRRRDAPLRLQVWLDDGRVFARWPSAEQEDLPRFHGPDGSPLIRPLTMADGVPARAAGVRFVPPLEIEQAAGSRPAADPLVLAGNKLVPSDYPPVTLVVARDATALYDHLRFLRWALLIGGAATMCVAVLVAVGIVSRGLGPLRQLAARISGIGERDLGARLADDDAPAEVRPVVDRLNDLLDRLETAFERERGFTADVAHELRTPLSGMRATIDVALARMRRPETYCEALADCREIVDQMQTMVESLLLLARLDTGQAVFGREPVPVADVADACWQAFADRADARRLTVNRDLPADLVCLTDTNGLALVMTNLMDNAVTYADDGGRIVLRGERVNGTVAIRISNSGCALAPHEVHRVVERFWRGDASRTETGVHCGLGLSLVQRIVAAMGGRSAFGVDDGAFVARITLPAG